MHFDNFRKIVCAIGSRRVEIINDYTDVLLIARHQESRYLIPQSKSHKSPVTAPIVVSVINFQTVRRLRPEGGPRAGEGALAGEYFVNHSTGFIIEDVRVNGGAAAASTAAPEKKGKASVGRDDGKRESERASESVGWMTRS